MNRFSSSTIEHLKNYVYQLRNPITGEVFYVGKGSGNRVFEHVRKINEINANDSPKVKLIQKIHLSGKKVIEEIIAYDLTKREALLIESSVIKSHSLDKLTNINHGYQGNVPVKVNEIEIAISEPIEKFPYNVLFLKINRLWKNSSSEEELYDAIRGYWRLSKKKFSKIDFVIGVTNGISRVIVKPKENKLFEAGNDEYRKNAPRKGEFYNEKFKGKFYFLIEKAPDEIIKKFLNKNFIRFVGNYRSSKRYHFKNKP